MNPPFTGMRIVHAASYQIDKDGAAFFNCDLKFHQGLVRAGCHVYPFSINDRARMLTWTNSKTFAKSKANAALLKTCQTIQPDALILGHGQYITRETLTSIKQAVPGIRIGYWYIDPLWVPKDVQHLNDRADLFDAICCTSGGELLSQFARQNTPASFIPNPVDAGVERYRAFECDDTEYDMVFFGRDRYAPQRGEFLRQLKAALPELRLGVFGSLGNPLVFGAEKDRILSRSRMALNLSRRNDVALYSSDRLAQLTGNGLATFAQTGAGLEQLYAQGEMGFYEDIDDLVAQVRRLLNDDEAAKAMAKAGWQRAHEDYSAASVATYLLNLTFGRPEANNAPWAEHVYRTENRQAA